MNQQVQTVTPEQIIDRKTKLEQRAVHITCLVPVYNEEAVIRHFVDALYHQLKLVTNTFDIVVIDDGSTDQTRFILRELAQSNKIKYCSLSRNFGKEMALTAGLSKVKSDVCIILDADFQHPVQVIPEFLREWANGYDMVYGERSREQYETFLKRSFTNFFYWILKKITKLNISSPAGDFRLLDAKVVQAIQCFSERTRFMKGIYAWVGYSKVGIPFKVEKRAAGNSRWGFSRLTELALTGIISFSDIPLRVWSLIGVGVSSIAFIYALYIITKTLIFGADLPGFPTLLVAILFLGGVQLLSVGILGEYIARIFNEVKQRPPYLISEESEF